MIFKELQCAIYNIGCNLFTFETFRKSILMVSPLEMTQNKILPGFLMYQMKIKPKINSQLAVTVFTTSTHPKTRFPCVVNMLYSKFTLHNHDQMASMY